MLRPAMLAPMPMPAWAPVLRELLLLLLETGDADVWEGVGVLDVVEDVVGFEVLEEDEEVLVAVEAGMEKVLLRSVGAGASKASAMGLLQSTTLLVVLQQFHCLVVVL